MLRGRTSGSARGRPRSSTAPMPSRSSPCAAPGRAGRGRASPQTPPYAGRCNRGRAGRRAADVRRRAPRPPRRLPGEGACGCRRARDSMSKANHTVRSSPSARARATAGWATHCAPVDSRSGAGGEAARGIPRDSTFSPHSHPPLHEPTCWSGQHDRPRVGTQHVQVIGGRVAVELDDDEVVGPQRLVGDPAQTHRRRVDPEWRIEPVDAQAGKGVRHQLVLREDGQRGWRADHGPPPHVLSCRRGPWRRPHRAVRPRPQANRSRG